ncbi:MAG: PhoH family protein, partial [Pseudomonadota bacterium]
MSQSGKPVSDAAPGNGGAGSAKLEFADNALAQALFGSHHGHLALIEEKLPIVIRARGNTLNLVGPAEAVAAARKSLAALYKRLERGLDVEPADVEAALRMAAEPGRQDFESLAVRTRTRHVTPRTPKQADYLRAIDDNEMVFGQGPAGTGKTYLAVAKAVERLVKGEVDRIILSRPAVEAGEQLGFLPGSMREKVDPYLRPLYDALYDMLPAPQVVKRLESG